MDSSSTVLESNPITVTQNAKSDCTDAGSTVTMTSGTPESWSYSVSAEGQIEYSPPISTFASISSPHFINLTFFQINLILTGLYGRVKLNLP